MTATLDAVTKKKDKPEPSAEQKLAEELVARAREQGVSLTGPDGLLKQLTKTVIETALNQELTEHLGHDKHGPPVAGNVRNGTRPKTVLTEASGQVPVEVPRDRAGTFEPQIVKKRQRRLTGVDEIVLSLYAKGLTTGEISAHFAEIYGASVSKETISRITDKVIEEMQGWQARPLDEASSGLDCHSASSSTTPSVTREIRSAETSTSYISRRCARMSRVVIPRAYSAMIRSLNPASRVWPLRTIFGSNVPARSRGTVRSTAPISVSTVLGVVPLRLLPLPRPAGSCFS
jgi:Transposase, Mutator family